MSDRFIQRSLDLRHQDSNGVISIKKLCELIEGHAYEDEIYKAFNINLILTDNIVIDNIDTVFKHIKTIKTNYQYIKVRSQTNQICFKQGTKKIEGIVESNPLIFHFDEYIDEQGEIFKDLQAYSLYESKSTYFEEFSMAKFANMLFENKLDELANYNLNYFKNRSSQNVSFNKHRTFRLVENNGEMFVRGITSDNYKEYGVDFAFVISMLLFHKYMKQNEGNNYSISFAAISESKLDLFISSSEIKDAGDFGKVSSAISISTNDVGKGALSFVNIIKLHTKGTGVYLYPESKELSKKDISIIHTTGVKKTLDTLSSIQDFYNYTDLFIKELEDAKNIKLPDDLRLRILAKCQHPNSSFREIKELKNIFGKVINNEISDFAKLLEMCNKAEELEITYDLKDKLRVLISQIILN